VLTRRILAGLAVVAAAVFGSTVPGHAAPNPGPTASGGTCVDPRTGQPAACAGAGQPGPGPTPGGGRGNYVDPCTYIWLGEDPNGGGSYYLVSCPTDPIIPLPFLWGLRIPRILLLKDSPPPERAARNVAVRIGLNAPAIGIAPRPGPDSAGLVGLWVWLWTEDRANTWDPKPPKADRDPGTGLYVEISAEATQIVWNMGDGTKPVLCTNPGRAYQPADGENTPPCGYKYQKASRDQPGGQYTVTATTTWLVRWRAGTANGVYTSSGQFTVPITSQTRIRIDELQVVVR
jgi:hypothetical protein